jgi:hypothetical protein
MPGPVSVPALVVGGLTIAAVVAAAYGIARWRGWLPK